MATKQTAVNVSTPAELQQAVTTYISQGYSLTTQDESSATLTKTAVKNLVSGNNIWIWVVCWFCFVIPALLFAAYVLSQGDQVIVVRVDAAAAQRDAEARNAVLASGNAASGNGSVTWSEDRRYWWDGTNWVDAQKTLPPQAK